MVNVELVQFQTKKDQHCNKVEMFQGFLWGMFCGPSIEEMGGGWKEQSSHSGGWWQVLYRLFTLSLWLLPSPVDSTRITIFMCQGQVKAAQIKGTIASLNDFTEYLKHVTAKKRRKIKMDWMTAGKFLQGKWKLVFTFVFTSCCRYPHHDVHV